MENNEFKKFIEKARNIKLSDNERGVLRQSLLNFISRNPLKPGTNVSFANQRGLSFWPVLFTARFSFTSAMAMVLLSVILVGGGVSFGAEKSMPGDVLYPVKVGVNEEVQGWFKVSDEAKADWEIKRAEKRLQEAEELAGRGSLNPEVSQNIEANFEAHTQKVKQRLEKFKSKENFNAAASMSLNFEAALKNHDKILSKISKATSGVDVQVKPIRVKIRSEFRESVQERKRINLEMRGETGGSAEPSGDKVINNVKVNEDSDPDSDFEADLDIEDGSSSGDINHR